MTYLVHFSWTKPRTKPLTLYPIWTVTLHRHLRSHLNLAVGQGFPDDEPVPEVGPRVDPGRLHDLEAAPGTPRLQVTDGEHQAPSEESI